MKTLKILKSKRGVAIENAILFLLVIFMLCALLASITIIANFQFKIDNIVLKNDVDLDQIGEEFIANFSDRAAFNTACEKYADKYTCTVAGNQLKVTPKDGGSVLLFVTAAHETIENEKVLKVLTWRYSNPETESSAYDSIGTDFLEFLEGEREFDNTSYGNYVVDTVDSEGEKTLTVKVDNDVKLYVEASVIDVTDANGQPVKQVDVLTWRYSAP